MAISTEKPPAGPISQRKKSRPQRGLKMKAMMIKVNYDPKYVRPNSISQKGPRRLSSRLGVMKRIYTKTERNMRDNLQEMAQKKLAHACKHAALKQTQPCNVLVAKKASTVQHSDVGLKKNGVEGRDGGLNAGLKKKKDVEKQDSVPKKIVGVQESDAEPKRRVKQEGLPPLMNALRRSKTTIQIQNHVDVKSSLVTSNPPADKTPRDSDTLAVESPVFERSQTMTFGECLHTLKTSGQRKFERRARKQADKAMKAGKVFTIIGPYPILRDALRRRGWVEKIHTMPGDNDTSNISRIQAALGVRNSVRENNDAVFKPWWFEDNGYYLIMSHALRSTIPSFVFTVKSVDTKLLSVDQMVNHFEQSRQFTTKAGLCQNIRNTTWFDKVDADSFYPRSYRLDDTSERCDFIDDYHMTACFGFLKLFVQKHTGWSDREDRMTPDPTLCLQSAPSGPILPGRELCRRQLSCHNLALPSVSLEYNQARGCGDGLSSRGQFYVSLLRSRSQTAIDEVPDDSFLSCLRRDNQMKQALGTAIRQCELFINMKEHDDIDTKSNISMQDEDWEQFLNCFYRFAHSSCPMPSVEQKTVGHCSSLVEQLQQLWPQYELDGCENVWILKPGAMSRGRGIVCLNKLKDILTAAAESTSNMMVIQKYIERPFLTYNTKFDIRQWFLVTSWKPLTFWFYNDFYLRFCSSEFTLSNFHASIHLSNNSVQKCFKIGARSQHLPCDNMWTSDEFREYLKDRGKLETWEEKTIPAIQQSILCSLLCSQEHIEGRKNAFELYGADFMLTEDLNPWLLEINSSPCMARTTHATAQLVDMVFEDTLKVVLDRKLDRNCETGGFQLAYKQPVFKDLTHIHNELLIEGRGVRKKQHSSKR